MPDLPISQLPYVGNTGYTNSDLFVFVNYLEPITGTTSNTTLLQHKEWVLSGLTNLFLPLSGGTVFGDTVFTSGLTANTISAATYLNLPISANTGIDLISNKLYTIYNTLLDGSLQMNQNVGGLPSGTTVSQLTGKTFVQLFDDILFPTVLPTYTIPTITMTGPSSQTLEIGSTYSPNISLFGIENDASGFTQLRIFRNGSVLSTYTTLTQSSETNVPNQFGFSNPNSPNLRFTINPTPYSESYVIPNPVAGNTSTSTYYGDGNYTAGLPKLNNKGQTDVRTALVRSVNAPQAASTGFQTSTFTITGIYPYFWGTSATLPTSLSIANSISAGTANKVLSQASGTLSIPFNVSGQFIWVAYQSGYTTKTKWFRTALDQGDIDGSFITTASTQNVNSPNGFWSGVNYKMHWSVYETDQTTLEFRNT